MEFWIISLISIGFYLVSVVLLTFSMTDTQQELMSSDSDKELRDSLDSYQNSLVTIGAFGICTFLLSTAIAVLSFIWIHIIKGFIQ